MGLQNPSQPCPSWHCLCPDPGASCTPQHSRAALRVRRESRERLLEKVTLCACSSLGCSSSQSGGKAGRELRALEQLGCAPLLPKGCAGDR